MEDFLFALAKTTISQIVGVLGLFFVFGFVLSKLQSQTHKIYQRTLGWYGILWTAWIGTPIHEFGHYIFAKIFRHKVIALRIFSPNRETGGLGHVDHTYNSKSLYQQIGNFFVGGAPLIFGTIFIYALAYLLLPGGKDFLGVVQSDTSTLPGIINSMTAILSGLFSVENFRSWHFWIFLYLSFCVASHLAPSKPDRKGMWKGFGWLVFVLLMINSIAILVGSDISSFVLSVNHYLGIFTGIFIYATMVSILHLLLAYVLLRPFRRV